MNAFREHHEHSIRFGYRCFDRILLNGLIQPFQQPERVVGFFNIYRELYPVSRAVLRDIATQYTHWVTAHAARWGVPIVEAPAEARRDKFVDPYFRRAELDQIVVILKAREPARYLVATGKDDRCIWSTNGNGRTSTASICSIVSGGGCSSASARTSPFRRGSV